MNKTDKILISIVSLILFLMLSGPAFAQDTVYGTINGGIPAEITVTLYRINCGGDLVVAKVSPDSSGDYSFGNLEPSRLLLVPEAADYSFAPGDVWVDMPQEPIQPFDFTATPIIP